MGAIVLEQGGLRFRSSLGRGVWKKITEDTLGTPGMTKVLRTPPSLVQPFTARRNRAQVPAIGIRILGSCARDNAVGATTIEATKLQLLRFFSLDIVSGFQQGYTKKLKNLAEWHFYGQAVNPAAANLDLDFYYDGPTNKSAPRRGIYPRQQVILSQSLNGVVPIGTVNSDRMVAGGSVDGLRDTFWRGLEEPFPVRAATAGTAALDMFISIPLCSYHYGPLQDSFPLPVLCDPEKGWEFHITQAAETFEGRLVHTADGGAITITTVQLYYYCIPQRDNDPYFIGRNYTIRDVNTGDLNIKYDSGDLILCSGNFPDCRSDEVDTVNSVDYVPGIEYGNYNPEFDDGIQFNWVSPTGEVFYPPAEDDRGLRQMYNLWNSGAVRPFLLSGAIGDVSVFSGRSLTGTRGYTTTTMASLTGILGPVSTLPVGLRAFTCKDLNGVPGLGSTSKECMSPRAEFTGNLDYTSDDLSGLKYRTDIVQTTNEVDIGRLKRITSSCCSSQVPVQWRPMVDDASKVKSDLVADAISGWMEDRAATNAAQSLTQQQAK